MITTGLAYIPDKCTARNRKCPYYTERGCLTNEYCTFQKSKRKEFKPVTYKFKLKIVLKEK